ncbi:MAG TPA: TIGR02444 family protein [Pseudolabrys sp.]|nr:TIGR02444 family protein [Pseudolabrys sp.]
MALTLDNPFWRFSLAVYGAPGVQAECLALQERFGIDVNVLLFCAWIGVSKRISLDNAQLNAIEAATGSWHQAAVQPLRAARQQLKAMPEMSHPDVVQLRKELAALELRAEQIEQALLCELASQIPAGSTSAPDAVRGNVDAYLRRRDEAIAVDQVAAQFLAAASQA